MDPRAPRRAMRIPRRPWWQSALILAVVIVVVLALGVIAYSFV